MAKGIHEVIVVAVNDACVMSAWCRDQGATKKLTFFADARSELATALGLQFDNHTVLDRLGNARCKRFALYVDRGTVKAVFVQQEHNGVEGTKESTYGQNMLTVV
mmetsp:Transcript_60284/g.166855  ORF Transcript_60284/g.166855 Transcript_60284/m.166855 type:complete len:105 (+) Transcript_60284:246-560(+)